MPRRRAFQHLVSAVLFPHWLSAPTWGCGGVLKDSGLWWNVDLRILCADTLGPIACISTLFFC